VPSRRRLKRLGKIEEWLHNQNGGAEKKIAIKIRSRLEVLKRDRVKNNSGCKITMIIRLF
jgi:hypothetical protein